MEAEAVSSEGTGRPVGAGVAAAQKSMPPLSPGASADEDIMALVATVDKARRAAQNASQVWFGPPSPPLANISALATGRVLSPWGGSSF